MLSPPPVDPSTPSPEPASGSPPSAEPDSPPQAETVKRARIEDARGSPLTEPITTRFSTKSTNSNYSSAMIYLSYRFQRPISLELITLGIISLVSS